MLKTRSLQLIVMAFVLLCALATAQNVTVVKQAPAQIQYGQDLNVNITITNGLNHAINITVDETIGNAQAIQPTLVMPVTPPGIIAARPPYFEWTLTLDPSSQQVINYTIRPNEAGEYLFSPTIVTSSDGIVYESNVLSTNVTCNQNETCEPAPGENYASQAPVQNVSGLVNNTTQSSVPKSGTGLLIPILIIAIILVCAVMAWLLKENKLQPLLDNLKASMAQPPVTANPELVIWLKENLAKGCDLESLKASMIEQGYSNDDIDAAINAATAKPAVQPKANPPVQLPVTANPQLVEWIKENLAKGYDLESLKASMIEQGYSKDEIDAAVKAAKAKPHR